MSRTYAITPYGVPCLNGYPTTRHWVLAMVHTQMKRPVIIPHFVLFEKQVARHVISIWTAARRLRVA